MLSRTALFLTRGSLRGARKYHQGDYKQVTMDDLPVPRGSWQANYDANQKKYNLMLAFGIAFATGSILVARASNLFYFNATVPKL